MGLGGCGFCCVFVCVCVGVGFGVMCCANLFIYNM